MNGLISLVLLLCGAALPSLTEAQITANLDKSGGDSTRVLESAGNVEVCVVLSEALAPGQSGSVQLTTSEILDARAGVDFVALAVSIDFISGEMRRCVNVTILDDGIEEGDADEDFLVQLMSADGDIVVGTTTLLPINIVDSDRLVVSFSQPAYTVLEGGTVEVCAFIENGTLADGVTVLVDIMMGITELNFVGGGNTLTFNSASMTACRNLTADEDLEVEPEEAFVLTLLRNEQSVEVDFGSNQTTEVRVQDDDFVELRLNQTTFRVPEGNLTENSFDRTLTNRSVCVTIIDVRGGLMRDVVVNVSTAPQDATSDVDFVSLNTSLTIPSGSEVLTQRCLTFSILGDDQNETNEVFDIIFAPMLDDFFENDEATVSVMIEEDGDLLDCRTLRDPVNGRVQHNGNDFGTVATYTCVPNFRLEPLDSTTRTCSPGDWDGEDPICIADCRPLEVANGMVMLQGAGERFIGEGTEVTYSCNENYILVGNESRTCQSDGTWTGADATCEPILCETLSNIANGGVRHDREELIVGATATYSCQTNFELVGGSTRTCMSNRQWSGEEPVCAGAPGMMNGSKILVTVFSVLLLSLLATIVL